MTKKNNVIQLSPLIEKRDERLKAESEATIRAKAIKDATTDGDHITKEHTRVQVIKNHGYKPIRIMFFYPQRTQAIRIQQTLKTLYAGVDGEYYGGDEAWDFLKAYSGVDLKAILTEIANERTPQDGN